MGLIIKIVVSMFWGVVALVSFIVALSSPESEVDWYSAFLVLLSLVTISAIWIDELD